MKTPPETRRYRSTRRDQQAAQTRHDVLMAAVRLFAANGWTGTTMAMIATEAGVAVETIYGGFGSKKQLLRAAMDVAIVGDTEPVALAERPEWQRMGEGSLDERLRAGIAVQGGTHARSAGIWTALTDAATSDADVAGWCTEMEQTRRREVGTALAMIAERPFSDAEIDLIWALLGPEVYLNLVRQRGWSHAQYESMLVDAVRKLIS